MSSELEDAIARLNALRTARSAMVLDVAGGIQQVRYPDGSGVTYSPASERVSALEPIDREIAALEATVAVLMGAIRRPRIRQVRFSTGKGLS
jgi:hypothetical protein